jgi:hypothetical protein
MTSYYVRISYEDTSMRQRDNCCRKQAYLEAVEFSHELVTFLSASTDFLFVCSISTMKLYFNLSVENESDVWILFMETKKLTWAEVLAIRLYTLFSTLRKCLVVTLSNVICSVQ